VVDEAATYASGRAGDPRAQARAGRPPSVGCCAGAELGAHTCDHESRIALAQAARPENYNTIAHPGVIGVDWRLAVLKALHEIARGEAELVLMDRQLDGGNPARGAA
jgi:hypothetical protein